MGGQSYNLSYNVNVKASISSIKNLVNEIQQGLNKISLPLGSSRSFNSSISTILDELKELDRLSSKTSLSLADTKNADKSWSKIDVALGRIKTGLKDLGLEGADAAKSIEKLFPESTVGKFKQLTLAIEKAQKALKGEDDSSESKKLRERLKNLELSKKVAEDERKEKRLTEKEERDLRGKQRIIEEATEGRRAQGKFGFDDSKEVGKYLKDLQQIKKIREEIKEAGKKKKQDKSEENIETYESLKKRRDELISKFNKKYGTSLKGQGQDDQGDFTKSIEKYKKAIEEIAPLQEKFSKFTKADSAVQELESQIEKVAQSLDKLGKSKGQQTLDELAKTVSELTGKNIDEIPRDLGEIEKIVSNFKTENVQELSNYLKQVANSANTAEKETEELHESLQKTSRDVFSQDQARQDIEHLQYQIRDFFSVSNTIQIFKRTVRDAFDTVKELDAVMTETAVVTDFTVSDMWDKLPEYAKNASELGSSISGLYKATTLYYQQGLGDVAAMDVGTETMKMARIANMEAADATEAMTAALRGFNMEIDKTSATRVNDVYSELAAITAADTSQIATAMTKTASIAASANMEFETTAAFLAQIIETTQEAPETAGTAMKTIIARFTEVKELFSQGMLTGEDSEGEAIEINKIDKALQSVGISLKDFLLGKKGIDDIFLELAEKWDTLDLATQRYIATTAAGSRQQSRFIAMMSDYDRTMELVNAANNSAGSSQEQFNKTLDSLDAKLQRLQNAWQRFTMGIVDSDLFKTGIDLLTGLLELINTVTEALGGFGGPLAKIGLIGGALKLGGNFLGQKTGLNLLPSLIRKYEQPSSISQQLETSFPQRNKQQSLFGQIGTEKYPSSFLWNETITKGLQKTKIQKLNVQAKNLSTESKKLVHSNVETNTAIKEAVQKYGKDSQEVKELQQQYIENQKSINQKKEQADKIEAEKQQIAKTSDYGNFGKAMAGVEAATAVLTVASATLSIAANKKEEQGDTKTAETLNNLSEQAGYASIATGLIATMGRLTGPMGAAITAGIVAIGGAVIQTLGYLSKKAYEESAEGERDRATVAVDTWTKDAQQAKISQQALTSSLEALSISMKQINELDRGTAEWEKAVSENNAKILEMADNYTELSGLIQNNGGVLSFDQNRKVMSYDTKTGQAKMMSLGEIMQREEQDNILADIMLNSAQLAQNKASEKVFSYQIADEGMIKKDLTRQLEIGWRDANGSITWAEKGKYFARPNAEGYKETFFGESGYVEYLKNAIDAITKEHEGETGNITMRQQQGGTVTNDYEGTLELAKAIAKGEVANYQEMENWLDERGKVRFEHNGKNYVYEDANYYINHNDAQESFDTLRRAGMEALAYERKRDELNRQQAENVKNLAETYGIESDFVKNVGGGVVEAMIEGFEKIRLDELAEGLAPEDKEEYAQIMGYSYDQKLGIFRNQEGVTVEVSDDMIAKALATSRAATDTAFKLNDFGSSLSSAQQDFISQTTSTGGAALTTEFLNGLTEKGFFKDGDLSPELFTYQTEEDGSKTITGITDFGKYYAKNLGIADTSAEGLQSYLKNEGFDPTLYSEAVASSLESGFDRIVDERAELGTKLEKYLPSKKVSGIDMVTAIENLSGGNADEARGIFNEIISSLEQAGNESLVQGGILKLVDELESGKGMEGLRDISDFVNEINWNNPIQAASRLKEEILYGSKATKEFAQSIVATGQGFVGAGSQVRYFLKSSDFDSMKESLDGILKTSSKITATDVLELADEYSSLNDILENTGVSAGALAKVLESLRENKISIDSVSNAVIAAIADLDGLNSMIANLNKTISNFDPGIDEGFAADFISQAYQTLNENIEAGAWGNTQNNSYMDFLFGEDWDKSFGEDYDARAQAMEDATKNLKKASEDGHMASLWQQLAAGQDFWGNTVGNTTEGGITIENKNGEIVVSGYEGKTTEQMVSDIAKLYNVSENFARMMLTDIKNHSKDMGLINSLAGADANEMMANMLPHLARLGENGSGPYVADESELRTVSQLSGIDYQTLKDALIAQAQAQGGTVEFSNFRDDQGNLRNASEILNEMDRLGAVDKEGLYKKGYTAWRDGFSEERYQEISRTTGLGAAESYKSQGYIKGPARFNTKAFKEAWENLDLPIEDFPAALQEAVDTFNTNGEPIIVPMEMPDGTWQDIKVQAGESLEAAYKRATSTFEQETLQSTISAAIQGAFSSGIDFGNIDITPLTSALTNMPASVIFSAPDTGPISEAIASMDGKTISVNLTPNLNWPHFAGGIRNAPKTYHDALTGEEGPELIERADGTAYLTGTGGPEVTTIYPGDTVYTADETRRIFKTNRNKGTIMPRYFSGYSDSKSGGKSTSGKDSKAWENPFDKLYNLLRKIDEELRERERIERRYEKLLEELGVSANKIIDISREELLQLEKERKLQEKLVEGRREQIKLYQEENAKLTKYANVTQNERGEDVLRIDWDLIDSVEDTEEGKSIEEYVKQLEEWFDSLTEAEDALWEIEDTIEEIKERGEDEYFDLEETIKDALEQSYQDQIDKLEDINDAINDTNAELLEGIQKSIEKTRQDRENEKTEEELSDKQRRLSYLQMDTSGANATEILTLQKELEEGQENYTDTLIDQKISELQEQNDEAAKQREKQIDLLQAQLDHYLETGRIWDEVYQLMDNGLDKDKGLVRGSRLEEILKNEENFAGLSAIGKQEWWVDMDKKVASALAYLEVGRQIENLGVKNKQIEFYTEDGKKLKGKVDDKGNVTTADGKVYNNVYQGANGLYYAGKNYETPKEPKVEGVGKSKGGSGTGSGTGTGSGQTRTKQVWSSTYNGKTFKSEISQASAHALANRQKNIDYNNAPNGYIVSVNPETGVKTSLRDLIKARPITDQGSTWVPYKTGGLADFTGPAWLDGTKSRPELVLNQRDTQNFIQLKDILSSLFSHNLGNSTSTENNGDITYDIDINVESIGSDYDVDKVASRVKTLITEDARYRNNNVIGLKR